MIQLKQSRPSTEERRNKLIEKLIAHDVYKINDKQLYQLTLPELEFELRKYKSTCHPHSDFGSIQWSKSN